jgi:predicted peroxiredoxin
MDIFSADDKKVTYTAPEGDDWPELSAHYKDMKKRGVKMLVDAHSNTITIEHPPKLIELLAVWMEES